jgi:hypothetical protein
MRSGSFASCRSPARGNLLDSSLQFGTKHLERCLVGPRSGTDDEIGSQGRHDWQDFHPYDLPKTPLEAITLHDRTAMLRHDDADSWMTQKGSEDPNLEMFGSSSLPFA